MAIQFEPIRAKIDPVFTTAVNGLSNAYYQFWRKGISCPWYGLDMLSKEEFDRLHGILWHLYDRAFEAEAQRAEYQLSRDAYDPLLGQKRRSELREELLANVDRDTLTKLASVLQAIKTQLAERDAVKG